MLAECRIEQCKRINIVTYVVRPRQDNSAPHVGPWQPTLDGGLMRFIYVPDGTDDKTTECLLTTP